ncbi:Fe(2+) transport protein 1 [Hibiscus syriacus]|uniref:Fe(2+) transport protein 1 n=1 Tax=Hibiscus syriacus TaxID=106335 RepID=A0A6A2Y8J7_HIBSY|nr:Fe(2+) transport protein 1 [Hibiscus syriacus]
MYSEPIGQSSLIIQRCCESLEAVKSLPKSLSNAVVFVPFIIVVVILSSAPSALAQCEEEIVADGCHDKGESMKLKVIAFVAILVSSVIGVSLPLFSRYIPSLAPDRNLFTVVMAFFSGVILATALWWIHLPLVYTRNVAVQLTMEVLELGIVVHSVVIGLAMGASDNQCAIRSLIADLCFHQMFEGMGLGGCILQAEYKFQMKAIMVFLFSVTTPLGIVLGIGLTKVCTARRARPHLSWSDYLTLAKQGC